MPELTPNLGMQWIPSPKLFALHLRASHNTLRDVRKFCQRLCISAWFCQNEIIWDYLCWFLELFLWLLWTVFPTFGEIQLWIMKFSLNIRWSDQWYNLILAKQTDLPQLMNISFRWYNFPRVPTCGQKQSRWRHCYIKLYLSQLFQV